MKSGIFIAALNAAGAVLATYNVIKHLSNDEFFGAQLHGTLAVASVLMVMTIYSQLRQAHR